MRALISDSVSKRSNVAVAFNRKGSLDLTYKGKPDIFRNAEDCQIETRETLFDVSCSWEFGSDFEAGRKKLAVLRVQMDKCLPQRMSDYVRTYQSEKFEYPFAYQTDIETGDDSLAVRLELSKYLGREPNTYSVDFAIFR